MSAPAPPPLAAITGYHAHVYFDPLTKAAAAALRAEIERRFPVEMGRWWDRPIGPHPEPMYQVAFGTAEFPRLVPWLMLNRGELTILVHPSTGDDRADHADYPMWLGRALTLRLAFFDELEAARAAAPKKPTPEAPA
ncbi:MAG: 4,5-dioxygenase [Alphaproteobacteria bacterium]|nr:4,5-dioxygenase [Alphaproteobacteria bacterium]